MTFVAHRSEGRPITRDRLREIDALSQRPPEPCIYINGRFLEQPFSGVQRYAHEMVCALDQLLASEDKHKERWCMVTTGRERQHLALERIKVCRVRSRLTGHAWEQTVLAREARKGVLIGFGGSGPLLHPRQLVIIHDASVYRHPEFFSTAYGVWHRSIGRRIARRARVGTVSRFSQRELAQVLGLDSEKIPVFYNGSDHMRRTSSSLVAIERLKLRGRPYFVLLGNLTPNKNVSVALEALSSVPDAALVLVGGVDDRVFANSSIGSASARVVFAGRLPDPSVAGLLGDATALIFPSLYEGFGIPPLEAMVRGCPVIASDIPPVREVCGGAAQYFDPLNPAELAATMRACLTETVSERSARIREGHARAATFTWESSAKQLLEFCRAELC